MSEQNEEQVPKAVAEDVNEVKLTKAEYDTLLADQAERNTLKAHHAKVADEKKQALSKAEREKAEAEGDLKRLLELKDAEIKERDDKLNSYENEKREAKVQGVALALAQELAKTHPAKAALLAKELRSKLTLTEDGVKVVGENGKLIEKLDTLKDYAQKHYDFLCDGVQSTGGAGLQAANTSNLNPQVRTMKRSDFNALSMQDQHKYFKENRLNKLID